MIGQVLALTREILRTRRNSLVGWTLALAATMVLMVGIFPAMPDDLGTLVDQYPEELLRALGAESIAQIDTAIGYLRLELFGMMLPLAVSFLPLGVFVRAVTGAEDRRYLTPLLALPLGRSRLIAAAALAATLALLMGLLAILASAVVSARALGVDLGFGETAQATICLFPLAMTVTAVGALICGVSGHSTLPTAAGGAFLIVIYLLSVLSSLVSSLSGLADINPWSYYTEWLNQGPVVWQMLAMSAVACAFTVCSALLFERRDVGS